MCLKLIPPEGTEAGQLVIWYDLARQSYFVCFSGAARTQKKVLGENIIAEEQREITITEAS